ncbi:MAG TPA: DMT family transporter [Gaiellaceae bacterium]|nr:DMT family transporter [Gaiellaceae bacterium]
MTAVLLALGASLAWGVADFVGPLKGRTLGTLRVLLWAQVGGLLAIGAVVAIRAQAPQEAAILLAVPAAISGILGLYAYYRGVATGTMSVVAPIAGASAIVPVLFGFAAGDRPSTPQLAGIAAAIVGVVLASREQQAGERRIAAGVGLALLAAVGFGFYFPPMHAAGAADFWWASLVFRATAAAVVAGIVVARRPSLRLRPVDLLIVAAIGIGDTIGNVLFAASSDSGLVSLTSVLASLYPIVTVLLAATVLHETVGGGQRVGIVLTLAGVVLIAAG